MPRNRTVRLAVLGSSVQRSAASKHPSRTGSALKRRLVVGALVLLSLALITVTFREAESGAVGELQATGATLLRPFQMGAERVARPFRDAWGYGAGLLHAKAENARLREELIAARQEAIQGRTAAQQVKDLQKLLDYRSPPGYPTDVRGIAAAVISYPTAFQQQIGISAGEADGVRKDDPVVTGGGLVGRVTRVSDHTAQVTLLTDESSAVSAYDVDSGAPGLIRPARAGSGALVLDQVKKSYVANEGDRVVTAGSQRGELPSFYPRGIPIGRVTSVSQSDTHPYIQIQVQPAVDFDALSSVLVLLPEDRER